MSGENENILFPGDIVLFDAIKEAPNREHVFVNKMEGKPPDSTENGFITAEVKTPGRRLSKLADKPISDFDLAESASQAVKMIIEQREDAEVDISDGSPDTESLEWVAKTAKNGVGGFSELRNRTNKDISGLKGDNTAIGEKLVEESGFPDLIVRDSSYDSVPDNYLIEAKNPADSLSAYQRGWMYKYRMFSTYVATIRPRDVEKLNARSSKLNL